jgi:hypothetical protein
VARSPRPQQVAVRAARSRAKAVVRLTRSAPGLVEVHDEVTPAVRQGGTRERIVFGSALAARAAALHVVQPIGLPTSESLHEVGARSMSRSLQDAVSEIPNSLREPLVQGS